MQQIYQLFNRPSVEVEVRDNLDAEFRLAFELLSQFHEVTPGANEEKELEYRAIAEQMASNGRGYLPNGADVKMFDPAARSKLPFYERIRYCDEQIVLAATGGLLTMLTQPGSGTLAGSSSA